MRGGTSREVVRHLRTLYEFGVAGTFSDEELLERFIGRRDEAAEGAFAELVQRHGPMVLGVCRRILGDAHEAEDAFQATFLVLARKAASVVRREKVASWLYGVAVRTAKEARGRAARRRAREERVSTPIHVEPPDDGFPDELRDILDEELARLPARHRGAVVLCELEGLSRPEAARRLGIPEGTLSSRLARAKARLRDRLARRGVALPAAALSAILLREAQAATLPLCLLESTVEAATLVATGPTAASAISASVASLSEGVIKTMLVAKLKGIVLAVGTMTAVVSGAVVLAQSGAGRRPGPVPDNPQQAKPEEPRIAVRSDQDDRAAALEKKLDRILDALERLSKSSPPTGLDTAPSPFAHPDRPSSEPKPPVEAVALKSGGHEPNEDGPRETVPPVAGPVQEPRDLLALSASPEQQPPPPPGGPLPPQAGLSVPPSPAPEAVTPPSDPALPSPRPPEPPGPVSDPEPPATPPQLDTTPHGPKPAPLSSRIRNLEQQMQQVNQRLERLERHLNALDARVGGAEERPPTTPAPPPAPAPSTSQGRLAT